MSVAGDVLGDAYVNVMAETGELQAGLEKAQAVTEHFIGNIGKTIVGGLALAMATAAGVVVAAFKEWSDVELINTKLSQAIERVGGSSIEVMPKVEALADSIENLTTIDDDATKAAITLALSRGVTIESMESMTKAAVGLSAITGEGLEGSMSKLIRASSGQVRAFKMMGVQIDTTKSKQEQFNQVMAFAAKGLKSSGELGNTFQGMMTRVKNAAGDVIKTLGEGWFSKSKVTEGFSGVLDTLRGIKFYIEDMFKTGAMKGFNLKGIGDVISTLIIKFTAMILTLPKVAEAMKNIFGDPEKIKAFFTELFIFLGGSFIDVIVAGFKATSGIFIGLGKMVAAAFSQQILKMELPGMARKREEAASDVLNKMGAIDWNKTMKKYGLGDMIVEKFSAPSGPLGGQMETKTRTRRKTMADLSPEQQLEIIGSAMPGMMDEGIDQAKKALPDAMAEMGKSIKERAKKLNTSINDLSGVDIYGAYKGIEGDLLKAAEEAKKSRKEGDLGNVGEVKARALEKVVKNDYGFVGFKDAVKKAQDDQFKKAEKQRDKQLEVLGDIRDNTEGDTSVFGR